MNDNDNISQDGDFSQTKVPYVMADLLARSRGEPNEKNKVRVICPHECHGEDFDRPSATLNVKTGYYHCYDDDCPQIGYLEGYGPKPESSSKGEPAHPSMFMEVLAQEKKGEWLYDTITATWYIWTGLYWRADTNRRVLYEISQFCREYNKSLGKKRKNRKEVYWSRFYNDVRSQLSYEKGMNLEWDAEWDREHDLLATPDAVYDLRTGEPIEPRQEHLQTRVTSVGANTESPTRWLSFLDYAFSGDEEIIRLLQMWLGYALTGHVHEEKMLFLVGPPGSGKSTLIRVIEHIFGSYRAGVSVENLIEKKATPHRAWLARLHNARLVTSTEPTGSGKWKSELSALISGDSLTANHMRSEHFDFEPIAKMAVIGNEVPALRSLADGMQRRLMILRMDKVPDAQEKERRLKFDLAEEGPQILRWMIQGAVAWYEAGELPIVKSVEAESASYKDDHDFLGQWMKDCLTKSENAEHKVSLARMYDNYRAYMKDEHNREKYGVLTKNKLSSSLRDRGVVVDRGRETGVGRDGNPTTCVWGYEIAEESPEEFDLGPDPKKDGGVDVESFEENPEFAQE